MTITPRKPALAVMAKVPVPGNVKTRLCPPLTPELAAEVHRCFVLDSLARARRIPSATPYLAFTPVEGGPWAMEVGGEDVSILPQEGGDLGERMDRLSRRLLAAGHPGVLITGTDCPTLPVDLVTDAVNRLRGPHPDVIIGPAEDGGYYLIGLRRPLPELFEGVRWGMPTVLAETLERIRHSGLTVDLLPIWFDVDLEADLVRVYRSLSTGEAPGAVHTLACLRDLLRRGLLGS